MRKPETRLVARIVSALEQEFGGWHVKIHGGPFQRAGLPDLFWCIHGLFIALEVKLPGEDLDPLQRDEIDLIIQKGEGVAACVHSVEEAIAVVRKALRQTKARR